MRMFLVVIASAFLVSSALAQSACETQAVGKDGNPPSWRGSR
jgi:hypothetical protein